MQASRGFTLTELVIVVAMVGILAAIALPSYREYVMRTNRTVAKTALQELLTKQESYAVDHKGYATDFERLGIAGSGGASTAYVSREGRISRNSAGALYALTLSARPADTAMSTSCANASGEATGLSFRLTASPVAASSDTRCGTLCVSSRGERGAALGELDRCWRR